MKATISNQALQWRTPTPASATPVKDGIYTTEMWGKVVLQTILVINAILGIGIEVSDEVALGIVGVLEAVYALSRGIAKRTAAVQVETVTQMNQTDKLIAAVVATIRTEVSQHEREHDVPVPRPPSPNPITVSTQPPQ